jgi:hypothetical protein
MADQVHGAGTERRSTYDREGNDQDRRCARGIRRLSHPWFVTLG